MLPAVSPTTTPSTAACLAIDDADGGHDSSSRPGSARRWRRFGSGVLGLPYLPEVASHPRVQPSRRVSPSDNASSMTRLRLGLAARLRHQAPLLSTSKVDAMEGFTVDRVTHHDFSSSRFRPWTTRTTMGTTNWTRRTLSSRETSATMTPRKSSIHVRYNEETSCYCSL